MSEISPVGQPRAIGVGAKGTSPTAKGQAPATQRGADAIELSVQAQLLSRLAKLPDVRQELVDRVRGEIEAGTYDTPDKIEALLDELEQDLH